MNVHGELVAQILKDIVYLGSDANKGISGITYNHLNLPTKVIFGSKGFIDYFYDASGTKQQKVVTEGSSVTTTDYAGNYVYENDQLQFFNHAEGYVEPVIASGSTAISSFNYIYQYKDHLGNIRLSYTDANDNGTISQDEIIEENNYYPFGLKHRGYNYGVSSLGNSTANKFKYNGRELQNELDLNWYDLGARNLDHALGRFMNVDPKAEEYSFQSVYAFANNNPVLFVDINGEGVDTIYENEETKETVEVNDGIDKTIKVSDSEFKKAKAYASVINPDSDGNVKVGVSEEIADGYSQFYNSVNSYDGFSLPNLADYAFNQPKLNVIYETVGGAGFIALIGSPLKASSKILNTTAKQLQRKFKHAGDFGVVGNYSKANAIKFNSAINQHINSSSVKAIKGTYRGKNVTHYLDSGTGLNVIGNPNGTFLSGWKLGKEQLKNVIKHGGLN